jgi:peptidoglycan hydrolase CwlO-like protein
MKPALLVLLILLSGAGIYYSLEQKSEFEETIQTKLETRDENERKTDEWHKTEDERAAAEKERDSWLKQRSEKEAEVARDTDTMNSLTATGEQLTKSIESTKEKYEELQNELAKYGVSDPQEIIDQNEEVKKKNEQLTASLEEKNTLIEAVTKQVGEKEVTLQGLQKNQADFRNRLAANSKEFSVVATDPMWGFVVVDAGEDSFIEADAILLVTRNGRNIAKLKVTSLEKSQTVADIVPGSLAPGNRIELGDTVVPQQPRS